MTVEAPVESLVVPSDASLAVAPSEPAVSTELASLEMKEEEKADDLGAKQKRTKQRSAISFPYSDLSDALGTVAVIHDHAGYRCELSQLVSWMGHDNVRSGTFRQKLATARTFGLIKWDEQYAELTPLGRQSVDPQQEKAARVEAFLTVPLYRQIYERFKGHRLPPDSGLESEMAALGVSSKQTDKARRAFQRSADQAGFFTVGRDRLVLPAGHGALLPDVQPGTRLTETGTPAVEVRTPRPEPQLDRPPLRATIGETTLHPALEGMLLTLPKAGSAWPAEKRKQWLDAVALIFGLVYGDE